MSDPADAMPQATDPNGFGLVALYRSRSTWNSSQRATRSSRSASVSGVMTVSDMALYTFNLNSTEFRWVQPYSERLLPN